MASATQKFRAACSALGTLCGKIILEECFIDDVLTEIESEISAIPSMEKALYHTRACLASAKNTSLPVNRLPPEVLGQVFKISTSQCANDLPTTNSSTVRQLGIISGVSVYWRKVALSIPSLWAHADVFTDSGGHLSRYSMLLLERSRTCPIHVHFTEPQEHTCQSDAQILDLANSLAPHMNRISSLDINSRHDSRRLIHSVINCWLSNGSPGSTKILSIRRPNAKAQLTIEKDSTALYKVQSHEHLDEILLPVHVLHLQNTKFRWDSPVYRGLVDLRLDFSLSTSTTKVSQSAFAEILASSSRLTTLKLSYLVITRSPNWDTSVNYRLGYLKALNLVGMTIGSLSLLLPMISLQNTGELSVGVSIDTRATFTEVLRAFFDRSSITTLFLNRRNFTGDTEFVAPLVNRLDRLGCLALYKITIGGGSAPIPSGEGQATEAVRPYHLDKLYLVSCSVNFEVVKPLTLTYGARNLHLVDCNLLVEGSKVTVEVFQDSLAQAYPEINCIFLSEDCTANWPCRSMMED